MGIHQEPTIQVEATVELAVSSGSTVSFDADILKAESAKMGFTVIGEPSLSSETRGGAESSITDNGNGTTTAVAAVSEQPYEPVGNGAQQFTAPSCVARAVFALMLVATVV